MVAGIRLQLFSAVAMACCFAALSGEKAVRAATGDTSTTVAAAAAIPAASGARAVQTPRWLGVAMGKIPPVFSRLLGLQSQQGLLVLQVIPNSPAFKARLEPGDLLISVNGRALENPFELIRAENRPGPVAPKLTITLIRDGVRKTITLRPVNRPHHLVFFFTRRPGPAGALPTGAGSPNNIQSTSLMTVGPGVRLHVPANMVRPSAGRGRPDLFTVRQWIGPRGNRHLEILWQSRAYDIQPTRLNRLPPPVQAVARLILRNGAPAMAQVPPPQMRIKKRLAAVKALIQKLQAQEKTLELQAAKCASADSAK